MDQQLFDDLTRILGSSVSRRQALRVVITTAFGVVT
jgi:hypothetical protein